jgi:SNF2 family DNA or RNA helicase
MIVSKKASRLRIVDFSRAQARHILDRCESAKLVDNDTAIHCTFTHYNSDIINELEDVQWTCEQPQKPLAVSSQQLDGYVFKTSPMEHQLEVFKQSKDLSVFAWLWDMGLGKTWIAINNANYLYLQGKIDRLLVIAPNGVTDQWAEQQLPQHFDSVFTVAVYSEKTRKFPNGKGLLVWCVNTDVFSRFNLVEPIRRWLANGKSMVVVDESHTIKTPGSKRTGNIDDLRSFSQYRRILSGTPITRGTEDIFTQYRFLDPNIIGATTFTGFTTRYCRYGGHKNMDIVGYKDIDGLKALIAPYTSRLRKVDCLKLPDKIYVKRLVELSTEQKKWYVLFRDALKNESCINQKLNVKNVMEQLIRLRQILGGYVVVDNELKELPCPRLTELLSCVQQVAGRVLVWASHTAEIRRIYAAIAKTGRTVVTYYGENTPKQRGEALETYKSKADCVFVSNPAAGGTGLNLDGASHAVYYSHSFNGHHRWQSEDRNHRATTTADVIYIDLVAERTLDDLIIESNKNKKSIADMTFDELKKLLDRLG